MPAPTPDRQQKSIGRFFRVAFQCAWGQDNSINLENATLVSLDDVSGNYNNPRFLITDIEWSSSAGVAADISFDSTPQSAEGLIANITPDSTSGWINFADYMSGGVPDPNRLSPGNVVVTTRNALPGDELFILVTGREKGTSRP